MPRKKAKTTAWVAPTDPDEIAIDIGESNALMAYDQAGGRNCEEVDPESYADNAYETAYAKRKNLEDGQLATHAYWKKMRELVKKQGNPPCADWKKVLDLYFGPRGG